MKQLLLGFAVTLLCTIMTIPEADARRLGGGKSFGRSTPSAVQQRQNAAPTRPGAPARAPATSGASRWLGPLAGLAAGGLLAAMLFGDGFENLQIFDILIIAGLIFGAIWLFRTLRRNSAGAGMPRQVAASSAGNAPASMSAPQMRESSSFGGSGSANADSVLLEGRNRPAWFNEQEFLQAAKTHFVRLQAAWDKGDTKDIREYTTPELFAQLTLERQSYGSNQFTEVVTLDAELLGLAREGDQVVASVRYSGMIREEQNAEAKPFSEIWHVQRSFSEPNADWIIAGIEQEG